MTERKKHKRLLADVKPERYRITIHPNFRDHTFSGEETIFLALQKTTRKIVLHSKNLKIFGAILKIDGKELKPKKIYYDDNNELVILLFARICPMGRGELFLEFKGKLGNDMRGFYKSRYSHNGEEKYLATTQFESTDARRAFPCVDEPEAKAVFDVTMIVPKSHRAISNTMPIEIGEHQSGYKVVKFSPTPKMSTYLLAFISGEFESVEEKNKDGVLVRVFTTPGKKRHAEFALMVAKKSLEFYGEYFGIKYPLPVLDMIAIPDFASGAMENWGAVTYRESALLVDPDHTASEDKQWVALVIAHELAHQWFGNLVTMKWWTDLWLNEGFASYIEYLAIDNIFPEWKIWKQFVSRELGTALRLDSLASTHPIEVSVNHPHEISEIFDTVSYSKGAVVIRMLAEYLGEKDFRKGMSLYLRRHSYDNAETRDLWRALQEISGKPVGEIMTDWTKQSGYPLLSIRKNGHKFKLKQSRFFMSSISRDISREKTKWKVPVGFFTTRENKVLLSKESFVLKDWNGEKINIGETSLYRAKYPEEILENMKPKISSRKFSAVDRLGIIRDVFALSESGHLSTMKALSMIDAYLKEEEYVVWFEIVGGLRRVSQVFSGEKWERKFREFKRMIFSPLVEKLDWYPKKGEPFTDSMLRDMAIWEAGASGDKRVIDKARRQFSKYLSGGEIPDKDIRSAVYFIIAKYGGEKEFKQFIKLYREARLSDEKNRLGEAIGVFENKELLKRALAFSLSKDVRPQDVFSILRSVARNPKGGILTWQFIKSNWSRFVKIYGAGGHMISKLIEPLSAISDKNIAVEIEKFFKKQKPIGIERTISQVTEMIRAKAEWRKRDGEKIGRWLSKENKEL